MQINHGVDEDTSAEKPYIVGGFASHGWLVSGGMGNNIGSGGNGGSGKGGDQSCFLFNLTLNLRFNARPGLDYYQFSSKEEIRFGNMDLVINDGFNSVTSKISVPSAVPENRAGKMGSSQASQGSHFCFGNDLTQKNRVQCIIPNATDEVLRPSKVEVWTFNKSKK